MIIPPHHEGKSILGYPGVPCSACYYVQDLSLKFCIFLPKKNTWINYIHDDATGYPGMCKDRYLQRQHKMTYNILKGVKHLPWKLLTKSKYGDSGNPVCC